jgi:hypothetical protein
MQVCLVEYFDTNWRQEKLPAKQVNNMHLNVDNVTDRKTLSIIVWHLRPVSLYCDLQKISSQGLPSEHFVK